MDVTTQAPWLKRLPATLYKLGAQAWIDYEYPRHIFLETTSACNLTCAYCPRENRMDHMDFSLFQALVDEATRYGPRSFSLHLFGEPTLYPKWLDAVAYIKRRNPQHTVLLTTNGTTLNRRVDDLVASAIDLVLWSWRPEATFTPATKAKLRKWGKFRVRFIAEVTPTEAYAEWADWPNLEGRHLHSYGGEIDVSQWNVQNKQKRRWSCYHLFFAPAVAWNGDILLCCADPHRKSTIGTFPQMSMAEAWQSEVMQRIRKEHLDGKYTGICENCDIWKQTPNIFFGHEYPDKTA
jgi:hypothetical protein